MGSLTFNWVFFGAYMVAMFLLGWYGYRRTKDDDDFSLGGRTFGMGVSVPLFGASFASAGTLIGYTGFAYANGLAIVAVYLVGVSLGWLILQLMSGKLRRGPDWHSTPQVFGDRYYSDFLRGWMALVSSAWMYLFVVIGLIGSGVIISQFLAISYNAALVLMGVVFLVYTVMGGMFSVAWTNVVQFILMVVGVLLAAGFGLVRAGGLGGLFNALSEIAPDGATAGALLTANMGGNLSPLFIFGLIIGLSTSISVAVYYHRTIFAARDDRTAQSLIGISAIPLFVFYLGIALVGLTARVLLPDLPSQEHAFPALTGLLHPAASALVMAAVISALMSSIDNQLLAAAVMVSRDIYLKFINPGASSTQMTAVSRWVTAVVGLAALATALAQPALVIDIYNFFIVTSSTTIFLPLILGLFWPRTTREAGIAGTLVGFFGALAWYVWGPSHIPATIPILPLVLVVMVVVSLVTEKPPAEVIARFHGETARGDAVGAQAD